MKLTSNTKDHICKELDDLFSHELYTLPHLSQELRELVTASIAARIKLRRFLRVYDTIGAALAAWPLLSELVGPDHITTSARPYAEPEDLEYLTAVIVTRKIINATL